MCHEQEELPCWFRTQGAAPLLGTREPEDTTGLEVSAADPNARRNEHHQRTEVQFSKNLVLPSLVITFLLLRKTTPDQHWVLGESVPSQRLKSEHEIGDFPLKLGIN